MKITNFSQFIPYRIFKLGFSIDSQGRIFCINEASQIYDDIQCKIKCTKGSTYSDWNYHGTDDINLHDNEFANTFYSITKTELDSYTGDIYLIKKNATTTYSPCVKIVNGCGPRYYNTNSNSLNFFAILDFCVKSGSPTASDGIGFRHCYSSSYEWTGTSTGDGKYKVAPNAAQGWHTYYLMWDHGVFDGYQWYWGNNKTLKPDYNVTPTEKDRIWWTGVGTSGDLNIQLPWRDYSNGAEFYQGDFSIYAIPDNVLGDAYSGDYNGTHYPGVYEWSNFAYDIKTTTFTGKNIMIMK